VNQGSQGIGLKETLLFDRLFLILLITLFCSYASSADEIGGMNETTPTAEGQDEILLKDGNILLGKVVVEREDLIVFETESLGRLEIPRANIERMALHTAKIGVITDPDQNTIMFCPTPATLPKGEGYFRDFELLILNFGLGVTDNFDLSFGTLFPVSTDALMFSFGGKLRLVDREKSAVGLALTGSFTMLDETQFGAVGAVVGIGDRHKSLNLAANYTFDEDGDNEIIFIIGGDIQTGRRTKFFAEYFSASSVFEDEDDDLSGFINLGIRIFGQRHSFSLSAFRPLLEDSGSFVAFPMLMYSYHW